MTPFGTPRQCLLCDTWISPGELHQCPSSLRNRTSAEALTARSVAAENARLRQQLHIARNALTQATPAACTEALRHIHDLEAGG